MFRISRLLPFVRPGLPIAICIGAVAALLVIGAMVSGGPRTAHADMDCTPGELCISLDPETASNPVNTDHTTTATVTEVGVPHEGDGVTIYIFDGPNAEEHLDETPTDANGEASFTYTGDGGAGTDSIIGIDCAPDQYQICLDVIYALRDCPNPGLDPTCLADAEDTCWDTEACIFDVATKEWVEPTPTPTATATPTATPTATATPTPTQEAAPAEELPATGGQPPEGSSGVAWLAVIAGAIAVMSTGGLWFAYQRRRAR